MYEAFVAAARRGGATVVGPGEASALVWADPARPDLFPEVIATAPGVEWIQLPYAGIEPFARHLDPRWQWTCGKGVYARPVAEHVLACALAGLRGIVGFARARSWPPQVGTNLVGGDVTVLGGGGITTELVRLLAPFECGVTVVRRHPAPMPGVGRVVGPDALHEAVAGALVVVVALALTPETAGIVDADLLASMRPDAWLVNVGRGGHVVTEDLTDALRRGVIAGAALDVTDPEPLPDDHPLWRIPTCLISPHVGNTPEMGRPLIAQRVEENVRRWIADAPLLGPVDVAAGY